MDKAESCTLGDARAQLSFSGVSISCQRRGAVRGALDTGDGEEREKKKERLKERARPYKCQEVLWGSICPLKEKDPKNGNVDLFQYSSSFQNERFAVDSVVGY